jgi:uncharacterized protein YjbI with pentapeptide repeats
MAHGFRADPGMGGPRGSLEGGPRVSLNQPRLGQDLSRLDKHRRVAPLKHALTTMAGLIALPHLASGGEGPAGCPVNEHSLRDYVRASLGMEHDAARIDPGLAPYLDELSKAASTEAEPVTESSFRLLCILYMADQVPGPAGYGHFSREAFMRWLNQKLRPDSMAPYDCIPESYFNKVQVRRNPETGFTNRCAVQFGPGLAHSVDVQALHCADLRGADLRGAALWGANLQGANLDGADMRDADLRAANLQGAGLRGAHLQRADLRGANMQGADLRGAKLQGAGLRDTKLQRADLRGANMQGADLQGAHLQRAHLRVADLLGADLEGANLEGAVLEGANLREIPSDNVRDMAPAARTDAGAEEPLRVSLAQPCLGPDLSRLTAHRRDETPLQYAVTKLAGLIAPPIDGKNPAGSVNEGSLRDYVRASLGMAHDRIRIDPTLAPYLDELSKAASTGWGTPPVTESSFALLCILHLADQVPGPAGYGQFERDAFMGWLGRQVPFNTAVPHDCIPERYFDGVQVGRDPETGFANRCAVRFGPGLAHCVDVQAMHRADLRGANLQGADLLGTNLQGADLRGANLEHADLAAVTLDGASLERSKLEGARLQWAHLRGADLSGTGLERAKLEFAVLDGASLQGANLEGALLKWASLTDADLRGANLRGAVLWCADLRGADLGFAKLQNACLVDANLEGANLEGANLEGADLRLTGRRYQ